MVKYIPPWVKDFLALPDTPDSYSGKSGQYLRAKTTEDELEFHELAGMGEFTVGDYLLKSADTERHTGTYTEYVKVKEIEIWRGGNLRIKFDLKTVPHGGVKGAYGKIYVNGSPVGTERYTTSESYVTYSEDIGALSNGDKVQLYIKARESAGYVSDAYCRNFRLYVGALDDAKVITD